MIYQIGETARLYAYITDVDLAPADPVTVKISITDPDGAAVITADNMETSATGTYYYDYLVPSSLGKFLYNITAVGGDDRITIVKDAFIAEAAL